MVTAPGLKTRPRKDGAVAHYWVASAVSSKARDYPLKTVRVHGSDEEVAARCRVLTAELKQWLSKKGKGDRPVYRGTLSSLIELYRCTADSPYQDLKSNSRAMYDESLNLLDKRCGKQVMSKLTGITVKQWYGKFKQPIQPGGPERVRKAYKAMQLLRILISFGVVMNIQECFSLHTVMKNLEFHSPRGRSEAITFEQAKAICYLAIKKGVLSVALAQALQFELTLRQIDVIGRWEKTDDPRAGGIVDRGQRWRDGLGWSHLDANGILLKETSKVEGVTAEHDTMQYPFLREIIDKFPPEKRVGPMIKSEATGLPYRYRYFSKLWREIATEAGVPSHVWNRDSRAGGVTEGSDAGANLEHLRHHANHKNVATTARYNRSTLEKTQTVAKLRVAHRVTKNGQRTDG
jgi:hypothetical protein